MEYIEIIKYFGRFPKLEGVLKNFAGTNDIISGYLNLKTFFESLNPHSLIPEITDYVISSDDKGLSDKISNISGWFLMVEPSTVGAGAYNDSRVRETKITIQLTIGYHDNSRFYDPMSSVLISDKGLSLCNQILSFLKSDDKELCANKRWLDYPFQIEPVEPYLLFQSIGWQLVLTRNYNILL